MLSNPKLNIMLLFSIEPVGSKAPSFSSLYKSFSVATTSGDNFALLCQAQAYPVPLIR